MEGINIAELVSHLVIYMVVLLLAISAHEAGHAWMSHKFGDDTAYMLGRVTLNPIAHTDPIGTLLIPISRFLFGAVGGALGSIPLIGWGKPTPVNPRNWTNYKTGKRDGFHRRRSGEFDFADYRICDGKNYDFARFFAVRFFRQQHKSAGDFHR